MNWHTLTNFRWDGWADVPPMIALIVAMSLVKFYAHQDRYRR